MGVYVKDATAPKNCTGCIAVHYYMSMAGDAGMLCEVTGLRMDDYYSGGRPDWCPLVDVPEPHGRLIDADALYSHIKDEQRKCNYPCDGWSECQVALGFVNSAPTVISASEEG